MKTKSYQMKKGSSLLLVVAISGFVGIAWNPVSINAQTTVTETTVMAATAVEIAAQELELKEKQLEYEKAKLDQQKSEALDIRKTKLEIEIKKLELLKARRDLLVQETKEQLAMQMEGDVLFDVNSAVIKPGAMPLLRQLSMILSEYPKGKVVVTGFADSTGKPQDNLELSRKRAESVKTSLLTESGGVISSERVIAQGLGESKPVASNMSSVGRQLNRRVEITVIKSLVN